MLKAGVLCLALVAGAEASARAFVHPGVTYTQGDLDRMRAMVAAGREPWKGTFDALKRSPWSTLDIAAEDRGEEIAEGDFNQTIGRDGRRAHDLALIWRLTDDERYAKKAVEFLNANSHYRRTSGLGTAALDNGKVYLLLEAAELLRDYAGWAAEDQARFRRMLTAPGCFHDHIRNFDCARFGNQGFFAARAMLAMGVYLDDDRMYERAIRYLKGEPHRADDAPYRPGPPVQGWKEWENEYMVQWHWHGKFGDTPDYPYDDQIANYIKPNGQCQEASRDQAHTICGLHQLVAIADIAWNQGDDLFSFADSRILLGLEWGYRWNLSAVKSYPDQPEPWQPSGYTEDAGAATFENGLYLQYTHQSRRWRSLKPTQDDRGDKAGSGGTREAALAHYAVRARLPKERYKWLERYRDYMIETRGCENWGVGPNWFYEWCGWGTLTKRRTEWMAGDPSRTVGGRRVSGAHRIGEAVRWTDFDYSPLADAAGKEPKVRSYTFAVAEEGDYRIVVAYTAYGHSRLAASVDKSRPVTAFLPKAAKKGRATIARVHFPAGACVLRLAVAEAGVGLKVAGFQVVK